MFADILIRQRSLSDAASSMMAAQCEEPARPIKKRNAGGRPTHYDWDEFHARIGQIANSIDGLLERPELHQAMIEWCTNNWLKEPAESEVRKRIALYYKDR